MRINNTSIYVAIGSLLVGVIAGWLLFGSSVGTQPVGSEGRETMSEEESTIWTCSMHPQVRRDEPGLCPICEMELIPLSSMTSDDPTKLQMTEESVKLAGVRTSKVEYLTVGGSELELPGKVQVNQDNVVNLVSHVPGRVEELFVNYEGEKVGKGELIASIYSPELISAQTGLKKAYQLKGTNPSLYRAAVDKLKFWKIDDATIQEFIESEEVKERFQIYAENGGVVTKKFIELGDYLSKGSPLLQVADLSRIWVSFEAYEDDLPFVKEGARITFNTPSRPGRSFTGRIEFIDPILDESTRTVSVRAVVNNRSGILKPGMLLYGQISDERAEGGLFVPSSAVLWTGERSVVYLKDTTSEIPTFQYKEVVLGEENNGMYRIESGLERGQVVVTQGNFAIDAEAQLNNKSSMMNGKITISGRDEMKEEHRDFSDLLDQDFKNGIDSLISSYLEMKNGFVKSDKELASRHADRMTNILEPLKPDSNDEELNAFWTENKDQMMGSLENIHKEGIEIQRKHFSRITPKVIALIKAFQWHGRALYIQYCPMAFDDQGAEWISETESIRNPYFGDAMLKCGKTTDTL